jgi:hypothetical protein
VSVNVCMHVCMYVFMSVKCVRKMSVCLYVCMYVFVYVCVRALDMYWGLSLTSQQKKLRQPRLTMTGVLWVSMWERVDDMS